MKLRRFCFALDLVDDAKLIAEYERWHAPGSVWQEVLADIRAQGVVEMEIWRAGTRMVMIVSATEEFPLPRPLQSRVAEWESLMLRYQLPLGQAAAGQKWMPMSRIFCLDEQPATSHLGHGPPDVEKQS